MYTVILLAALGQPQGLSPHPQVGLPPLQGVARINAKSTLAIARVNSVMCSGYSGDREVWLQAPEKKPGEKVMVKAKITRVMVSVVELPAHIVEAYTADGKPIEPAKRAEMLAQERTVLIAMDGKKVDPFQLQLYKEDTIILVPANLEGLQYGPYITPASRGPEEMPPSKKMPAEKDRPKTDGGKMTSARANTVFISQDDEKGKTPEAPALTGIGGILRMPDKLPRSFPPTLSTVVLNLGDITLMLQAIETKTEAMRVRDTVDRQVPYVVTVNVNGRIEQRTAYRTVTELVEREVHVTTARVRLVKQTVPAEKIKAFTVTKAGKLEAISNATLVEMLAKPTPALIGDADLDPRHLELIRPGTLFLAIPPDAYRQPPPLKEPIQPKKENPGGVGTKSNFPGIVPIIVSTEFGIAPPLLDKEADIKKLNQTRVEAAKTAHALAIQSYKAGNELKPEEAYIWSVRWLKAQQDLDGKEADRLVALKDHFQRMKDLGKLVEAMVKAKERAPRDAAAAQYYVAEAELWFVQAQPPVKKDPAKSK